ncbi:putative glutamyl endopeptidase, chloroplastic, partial [Drosera capensis]
MLPLSKLHHHRISLSLLSLPLSLPLSASSSSTAAAALRCPFHRPAINRFAAVAGAGLSGGSSSSLSLRMSGLVSRETVSSGGDSNDSVPAGAAAAVADDYQEDSSLAGGYQLPPPEIRDIVDAPPVPALSFSPNRDKMLFLKRRALPPLADLARPEEKLAGIRIDGKCNSRSRMSYYTGIGIYQFKDDGTLGPEKEIHGLPEGARINFVSW